MLQRSSVKPRPGRINRLNAWIAAILLRPPSATAGMLACLAVFLILGLFIDVLMKPAENLFMDSTEAYAWGMQFLGGYGRHPPLAGWIAGIWYSVFPAANWASYALSQVMTCISLVSIYLIGQRVLGRRRATLVVFVMMLYPLFIGAKSDRFNNYQVLLAVLPLMVWLFLQAYDRPTVKSGIALGLAAAAATLTIYSAVFGLIGMALAAVLHPGRRRFFTNPAPYVAAIVYVPALTPHIVWLINNNFSSLRWAGGYIGGVSYWPNVAMYLGQHFALLAFCLVGAAIALWPWRLRAVHKEAPFGGERPLVLIVAGVLVGGPVVMALLFNVSLKLDWGNPLFFLLPIAVASLLPNVLVTRQAVAKSVWVAAIFAMALLVGAPVYSWARFKTEADDGLYRPFIEAAAEITQLWRDRFHSPLPIVVSGFEIAAPMVFYSADHPKMFADFDAAYSPWIDYPGELVRKGYVGVCFDDDANCRAYLKSLNPNAERFDISLQRRMYGLATPPLKLHLEFTAPKS
jgi:4-amino-4-deoxy-L-arabinose transferase-like glycosyltransferase